MWVAETGCEPRSENSGTTALTSMPSSLAHTGVTGRLSKMMILDFPAGAHSSEKDLDININSPHNTMLLTKRSLVCLFSCLIHKAWKGSQREEHLPMLTSRVGGRGKMHLLYCFDSEPQLMSSFQNSGVPPCPGVACGP